MKAFKKVLIYVTVIASIQLVFILLFCAIARSFEISTFHPIAWGVLFAANVGFLPLAIDVIENQ